MFAVIALIIIGFGISMMCIGSLPSIIWKDGKRANRWEDPTATWHILMVLPPIILCGFTSIGILSVEPLYNLMALFFMCMCILIAWFFIAVFGSAILAFIFKMDVNRSWMISSWSGFILLEFVVALFWLGVHSP